MNRPGRFHGFTLIELLIVVAIIAILAAIAVVNMREATERALRSSDAANLHTLATALQSYVVDYGKLPPADGSAGPQSSMNVSDYGNGPAGGGYWDGVPWVLVDRKYVSSWQTLFCPKYLKLYRGTATVRGGQQRYHNFRYAYNMGSAPDGGVSGGSGLGINNVWVVRDLNVSPDQLPSYPRYPADFYYPWGERDQEFALYGDMAMRLVKGGTDEAAK